MLDAIWNWLQSQRGENLVGGLLGAAVAAAMEYQGALPALRNIFVGTICALYLSPLALPLLSWALGSLAVPQENVAGVGGFIVGMVGIIIVEIILKAFRLRRDELTAARREPPTPQPDEGEREP